MKITFIVFALTGLLATAAQAVDSCHSEEIRSGYYRVSAYGDTLSTNGKYINGKLVDPQASYMSERAAVNNAEACAIKSCEDANSKKFCGIWSITRVISTQCDNYTGIGPSCESEATAIATPTP